MSIRVSGIASGLDTDSIVEGLSSAYQVKIDNVTKSKKKLQYQQEAWETLNKKLMSLYKGTLTKMKTYGNYKSKKATVSGLSTGSNVSVTASNSAVNGTYKLKVTSTASSAFVTSANLSSQRYTASYNAANATSFKDMYSTDTSGNKVDLFSQLDGKTITFKGTEQVAETDADGNALYTLSTTDENGAEQSATITLYDEDGNVTGTTDRATAAQIDTYLSKMAENDASFDKSAYTKTAVTKQMEDVTYTFSESSSVADINQTLSEAGITGLTVSMENGALKFTNTAGYTTKEDGDLDTANAAYTVSGDALASFGFASNSVDVQVSATQGDDGNYTFATSESGSTQMNYDIADTKLTGTSKVSQFLGDIFKDGAQEDENGKYITYNLTVGSETTEVKIYENQSMNDFASAIQTASDGKVTAAFDATNQRFFLTSSETGADNNFSLEATAGSSASEAALQKLGLIENSLYTGSDAMASHTATDAVIELNGAVITSSTNDISVSGLGLTISVAGAKEGEDLTIDVGNDTDGVYDMIKDFFTEYNNLLADMNEMYYAEKTGYEPLTDDEEDAMTESQVEKWETKVKASVLRSDDRLNTLLSSMRTILTSAVTVSNSDGSTSKLSLASFGVTTGEWTEYGLMHIAGDEDDAEYSDKTNKLKNALESDPDKVMNTFGQVMTNLYNKITSMSKSSTTRTYGNVYNDKTMTSQLEDYDDEIETLQDKLTSMQDRYYSQFSAMEVALSKLNSTASSLGFSSTSS